MPSKTDPSPRAAGSTVVGSGAHGPWLEVSSTSAMTGARSAARELRAARAPPGVNWSGMAEKPNFGPAYPSDDLP